MDINTALNEVFVKVFKNIMALEEQAIRSEAYQNATANDMHVMEAIGNGKPKNMTSVARSLSVTTGTLTISVNSLVKKGFVERVRSEEDRRVVLISLTEKGKALYRRHQKFHEELVERIVNRLNDQEKVLLEKVLSNLNLYFKEIQK
ncbi:MarR family transcriptional regulator [Lachnospiraceae bacterium JLR.KK008]